VAVSVVSLSLSVGLIAGALSGFYGGWTRHRDQRICDQCVHGAAGILLAIAFVAFLGPGLFNLVLALSISGWGGLPRGWCGRR